MTNIHDYLLWRGDIKLSEEHPFNEEYCYIFTGDYLDRGNQNAEVFLFLDSIKDKKNVCLVQGNHEYHIQKFATDVESPSKEFERKTQLVEVYFRIRGKKLPLFFF